MNKKTPATVVKTVSAAQMETEWDQLQRVAAELYVPEPPRFISFDSSEDDHVNSADHTSLATAGRSLPHPWEPYSDRDLMGMYKEYRRLEGRAAAYVHRLEETRETYLYGMRGRPLTADQVRRMTHVLRQMDQSLAAAREGHRHLSLYVQRFKHALELRGKDPQLVAAHIELFHPDSVAMIGDLLANMVEDSNNTPTSGVSVDAAMRPLDAGKPLSRVSLTELLHFQQERQKDFDIAEFEAGHLSKKLRELRQLEKDNKRAMRRSGLVGRKAQRYLDLGREIQQEIKRTEKSLKQQRDKKNRARNDLNLVEAELKKRGVKNVGDSMPAEVSLRERWRRLRAWRKKRKETKRTKRHGKKARKAKTDELKRREKQKEKEIKRLRREQKKIRRERKRAQRERIVAEHLPF